MFHELESSTAWSNYLARPRRVQRRTRRNPRIIPEGTMRTANVARLCGVSVRQLQWWDEQGFISPRHSGHMRVYTDQEVRAVKLLAELRRKGIIPSASPEALKLLPKLKPGDVIVYGCEGWLQFATDADAMEYALGAPAAVVMVQVP